MFEAPFLRLASAYRPEPETEWDVNKVLQKICNFKRRIGFLAILRETALDFTSNFRLVIRVVFSYQFAEWAGISFILKQIPSMLAIFSTHLSKIRFTANANAKAAIAISETLTKSFPITSKNIP